MTDSIAALERRLNDGWEMCEATDDFNERARLDRHWLQLLRDYEAAVDAERRHQEGQVAA